MLRYRYKYLGGLGLALAIIASGALLFRPRDLPPPGMGNPPSPAASLKPETWPRLFTDALDVTVTLAAPAQRIVTLSPNLAEIICAVGAEDQLVGVDDYTTYPSAAAAKPRVGGIINPNFEVVVALDPDLVLVSRGVEMSLVRRLSQLGLTVLGFDPQSLEQVVELILTLGELTGREEAARQMAAQLEARRDTVRAQAARPAGPPPRALVVISWEGLFVAGASSFLEDVLTTAGAVNAVRSVPGLDLGKPFPQLTREQMVVADPQVLIFAGAGSLPSGRDPESLQQWLQRDPACAQLGAVRAGHLVVVDDDLLSIPGPRLFDGLEQVAAAVSAAAEARE